MARIENMKREIKFKAWDEKRRKMVLVLMPDFVLFAGKPELNSVFVQEEDGEAYWLERNTEMLQFTGLFDKNGKEIYEGDILRMSIYFGNAILRGMRIIHAVISFHSGGFWFDGGGFTDCNWHHYNASDREIIGNIYENPELIEKEVVNENHES